MDLAQGREQEQEGNEDEDDMVDRWISIFVAAVFRDLSFVKGLEAFAAMSILRLRSRYLLA